MALNHIGCQHNYDSNVIWFSALEHVPTHFRGGGIDVTLLQLGTKGIHSLDATKYLNEYIRFK